ncbi:ammonium transporter [Leifsonia shinshuensis]|uniref:Ammonium transporter n=1 Tax=Leifsonia shinshuensis TaxID=150026 RepID=A0A853CWS5_9MICO|nr:ammonium transporter [Leifsonia shinshuensis]NYJ23821.1 Amt family ammonium transporter [Leifsonia shinshuensis]
MAATSEQVDALLLFFCGALTLLVPVGLAFFVGGLGGRAAASRALLFALTGTAVTVLLGVLGGYGMLAGRPLIGHLVGMPSLDLATGFGATGAHGPRVYDLARAGSLLAVCCVSVAIVGVAVASRVTLRAWLVLTVLWSVLVLYPAGYAVFALDDGWATGVLGVIDFGGALPIGVAAGAAAAGVILACGRTEHRPPEQRSFGAIAIGGTLVWVGWLGLVVGSEGAVDSYTGLIAINAFVASGGGCLAWMIVDRVLLRRPTTVSALCGAFSGLVAITAAAGVLTIGWSLLLGTIAALACATMVDLAARARFGPSMALIVIVTVASLVGLLYLGLFAAGGGMVDSGNFDLFTAQAIAGFSVLVGSFLVGLALALVLRFTLGLTRIGYRASNEPTPGRDRPTVPARNAAGDGDSAEAGEAARPGDAVRPRGADR